MEVKPQLLDDYVHLTGRPSVRAFISFMRRHKINGVPKPSRDSLIQQWQQAHGVIRQLEQSEKGAADDPELRPLSEEMRPQAEAALENPSVKETFDGVRYRWQMLELDRLVVFQQMINLRYVDQITSTLPPVLTPQDVINVAIGKAWEAPPVHVTRTDEYTFACVSSSNDVRVLEIDTIDPAEVQGLRHLRSASAIIGISVGHTANMLTAVRAQGRLVIYNGSHRAYALRKMGITHAPGVVVDLSREDEFDLKAPEAVKENRDLYLRSPRPPMFKDYFDTRLHTVARIPRIHQLLQFQIGYQKIPIAAI